MNCYHVHPLKMPLLLALGALLWAGSVQAQETPATEAATTEAPTREAALVPADVKAFEEAKQLVKLTQLWTKPLDWDETGASTDDIVSHLKKALGEGAPTIEVRGKDTNRSTFVMKAAPLGPTLSAVADLANMSVWVFPSRLLLAPESALSPAERSAIKEGTGGEWKNRWSARGELWTPDLVLEKIGVSIVGAEVKAHQPSKSTPTPAKQATAAAPNTLANGAVATLFGPGPSMPYELTFGELSPSAQAVLQDMLSLRTRSDFTSLTPKIEDSAVVGFDDTRPFVTEMRLQPSKTGTPSGRQAQQNWFVFKPHPAVP